MDQSLENTLESKKTGIAWGRVAAWGGLFVLLIVVGVAIDTIAQMESHMLTRHYEGFLKKGSIKGRR